MLLTFTKDMLTTALQLDVAYRYQIDANNVKIISYDPNELITGDFKDKLGDNIVFKVDLTIGNIPLVETNSEPDHIYQVAETYIVERLGMKRKDFTIVELFLPENDIEDVLITSEFKSDESLCTVIFYLNDEK
jgi:hypothetical protein